MEPSRADQHVGELEVENVRVAVKRAIHVFMRVVCGVRLTRVFDTLQRGFGSGFVTVDGEKQGADDAEVDQVVAPAVVLKYEHVAVVHADLVFVAESGAAGVVLCATRSVGDGHTPALLLENAEHGGTAVIPRSHPGFGSSWSTLN